MIFFVYGTSEYLCRQKLEELKNGFKQKKDKAGFNVVQLLADEMSYEQFAQEAMTVPFLSDAKFIIVENLLADNAAGRKKMREQIAEFIRTKEKTLENNLIFLDIFDEAKKIPAKDELFNLLKKQKYAWQLSELSGRDLSGWIKKYCEEAEVKITPRAIDELILLVGNDLQQLAQEITKLRAYKNGGVVDENDIKIMVKAKADDNIFKLTDALSAKKRNLALQLINDQIVSGNAPLSLLGSISWQFKSLLKIKSLAEGHQKPSSATIASKLGLHPYVAQKGLAASRGFTLNQLIKIQNELLVIEQQLKSGAKNPELLFDLFIIKNF
ncbi:MAG: DNA polymerase III subunit delta [Patescibacteria group bacterium]